MQSKARTVAEYLLELPEDRRREVEAVRRVVRKNLGKGFQEGMQYGMIAWFVPHSRYPAGYHCDPKQPLPFVCLASQKNHLSLYMMCMYSEGDDARGFREAWARTGKKLDMGKSCIRFRKADDLALDLIGEVIRRHPVDVWIRYYEDSLKSSLATRQEQPVRSAPSGRKPKTKPKAKAGAKASARPRAKPKSSR
ncbi:MAG: DUF1801 domain-containing protein [Planctomyces sp.]|nr:DUF1801 domain-containing protein [Planctomyces sp.]